MLKRALVIMSILGSAACAGGSGGCGFVTGVPQTVLAPGLTAPSDRKYLLERVDDAAIVQVYADGFKELSLKEKTLVWHLYQAAIAGRDIFYDQRYAHNLEMRDVLEAIVTHKAAIDAKTFAEVERYTKLFWINSGPFNNLTARKFVPDVHARGVCRRRARRRKSRRAVSAEERRDARSAADAPPADVLRSVRRSHGDRQDAAARQGHPGVEREQPLRRRDDEGSRGVSRSAPAQLAPREAERQDRRRGVSRRRTIRRARSRAIVQHLEAAIPFATEPMAKALARAHQVLSDRGPGRPRGVRHRLGAGQGVAGRHHQRFHRGVSRRARDQRRMGRPRLLRESREDLRDPEDCPERAVVRRPHAVGPEVPQGRA